jgi:hypothetical protein
MTTRDTLLQGEAITDIQLISLDDDASLEDVLREAAKLRNADAAEEDGAYHVYVQDEDAPLKRLPKPKPGIPLCLHVSRCRKVDVSVSYNGKTKALELAPSRTVGAVKLLAAIKLFGMSEHDAAEHVLQLAGTDTRPDTDIHIGSLARRCKIAFDLVPHVRVEG